MDKCKNTIWYPKFDLGTKITRVDLKLVKDFHMIMAKVLGEDEQNICVLKKW